jgi:hypothetical protein
LLIDQNGSNLYYHAFTDSPIAQSVEQRTVNPCVAGSSPARGAKFKYPLRRVFFFLKFALNQSWLLSIVLAFCCNHKTTKELMMLDILFKTPVGLLSVLTLVMVFVIMGFIYRYFYKKMREERKSE